MGSFDKDSPWINVTDMTGLELDVEFMDDRQVQPTIPNAADDEPVHAGPPSIIHLGTPAKEAGYWFVATDVCWILPLVLTVFLACLLVYFGAAYIAFLILR